MSAPGLYANLPLPTQQGTPFTWDNSANPIKPTSPTTPPNATPIYKPGDYVPGALSFPAPGTFWIIDYAEVTFKAGPSTVARGASPYLRPQFAADPPGSGDGPYLAHARGVAGRTLSGSGQPGPEPSVQTGTIDWTGPIPVSPSCELGIITGAVLGDEVTFHIEGHIFTMEQGQAEVVYHTPSHIPVTGIIEVEKLGYAPAGFALVPVLAEVNLSTGPESGDRRLALFFGGQGLVTNPGAEVLADSGTLDAPNVGNNNTTGSYVPNGSGPGDATHHTLFPPGIAVVKRNVFLYQDGLEGDSLKYTGVFLATPAVKP
jgi:hypothetical protein